MKVLLENLLRNEDGRSVSKEDIQGCAQWLKTKSSEREIAFHPARVLMQDFTGVPAVVDLAAMRDAMVALGGDPEKINPLSPVDLVIDHSVMVEVAGSKDAFDKNVKTEFERYGEWVARIKEQVAKASDTLDKADTRAKQMRLALRKVEALPEAQTQALLPPADSEDDSTP